LASIDAFVSSFTRFASMCIVK